MAAETKVGILVEVQDKATAKVKDIGNSLSGLASKAEKYEKELESLAAVSGVAFGAISFAVYKSVQAANEAEQANAQLTAVLKSPQELPLCLTFSSP